MQQLVRTIFYFPSLIKCLNVWLATSITVSWMVTHGIIRFLIAPEDQEKTMFTCPFGTFAYRRMPFGLCNAPLMFQRCMLSLFSNMVERFLETLWMISPSMEIHSLNVSTI